MDIFSYEARRRLGDGGVLRKVDALLDWTALSRLIDKGLNRSGLGPQGYDPVVLFKCLLLGQWHGLSDPKLEESLRVRLDFMLFVGLDLHAPVPDETTHCRFRNALVKADVYDTLLEEVCRQLEGHGLKLRQAEAAILDATLIEAAARPRGHIEAMAEDRGEPGAAADDGQPEPSADAHDDAAERSFSADADARWVKKGRKSTFGYKGFARTDEEGFIDKVHVKPANAAESPEFGAMIKGAKAQRVLADKAYASKANRAALQGKHRDGIMRKAVRGRPLRASEKRFNRLISKRRFRVEQAFGTLKRLFGLDRARYFGCARTHAQMAMAAIASNLLKAANKITLNAPKRLTAA